MTVVRGARYEGDVTEHLRRYPRRQLLADAPRSC
jgi:hypothetical protein